MASLTSADVDDIIPEAATFGEVEQIHELKLIDVSDRTDERTDGRSDDKGKSSAKGRAKGKAKGKRTRVSIDDEDDEDWHGASMEPSQKAETDIDHAEDSAGARADIRAADDLKVLHLVPDNQKCPAGCTANSICQGCESSHCSLHNRCGMEGVSNSLPDGVVCTSPIECSSGHCVAGKCMANPEGLKRLPSDHHAGRCRAHARFFNGYKKAGLDQDAARHCKSMKIHCTEAQWAEDCSTAALKKFEANGVKERKAKVAKLNAEEKKAKAKAKAVKYSVKACLPCLKKFQAAKGCQVLNNGGDPTSLVPKGCIGCAEHAETHCKGAANSGRLNAGKCRAHTRFFKGYQKVGLHGDAARHCKSMKLYCTKAVLSKDCSSTALKKFKAKVNAGRCRAHTRFHKGYKKAGLLKDAARHCEFMKVHCTKAQFAKYCDKTKLPPLPVGKAGSITKPVAAAASVAGTAGRCRAHIRFHKGYKKIGLLEDAARHCKFMKVHCTAAQFTKHCSPVVLKKEIEREVAGRCRAHTRFHKGYKKVGLLKDAARHCKFMKVHCTKAQFTKHCSPVFLKKVVKKAVIAKARNKPGAKGNAGRCRAHTRFFKGYKKVGLNQDAARHCKSMKMHCPAAHYAKYCSPAAKKKAKAKVLAGKCRAHTRFHVGYDKIGLLKDAARHCKPMKTYCPEAHWAKYCK